MSYGIMKKRKQEMQWWEDSYATEGHVPSSCEQNPSKKIRGKSKNGEQERGGRSTGVGAEEPFRCAGEASGIRLGLEEKRL